MDAKPRENLKDLNRRDNVVIEKVLKLKSAKKIFFKKRHCINEVKAGILVRGKIDIQRTKHLVN